MGRFLCALFVAVVGLLGSQPAAAANGSATNSVAVAATDTTSPAGTGSTTPPRAPADASTTTAAPVDFFQVEGLFDDIIVNAIDEAITDAASSGSQALVLQVNTPGAVVSAERMAQLLRRIQSSPVPIAVWVGPSGSRLTGTPAQMLAVADVTAMAPGCTVGNVGAPVDPSIDLGSALTALANRTVQLNEARTMGVFKQRISDEGVPNAINMVYALDGFERGGTELNTTTETVTDSGTVQQQTVAPTRFSKLNLVDQLFHTVASPPVAYLLLLVGLLLIVLEFYTAGVGIAAVVGAACVVLAATGLAALPTRPFAVALVLLSMIAFAVDVQVGVLGFWTVVGSVFVIAGSLFMFGPVEGTDIGPGALTLAFGIGGTIAAFGLGMPLMTRSRFGTQSIPRDWMIDQSGTAVGALDPVGVVEVDGAQWRGRATDGTVAAGATVRVTGVDDITLEVSGDASP